VQDVSVEDPPLEEVIAEMFSLANEQAESNEQAGSEVAKIPSPLVGEG
jgi:hypothetical protein